MVAAVTSTQGARQLRDLPPPPAGLLDRPLPLAGEAGPRLPPVALALLLPKRLLTRWAGRPGGSASWDPGQEGEGPHPLQTYPPTRSGDPRPHGGRALVQALGLMVTWLPTLAPSDPGGDPVPAEGAG